MRQLLKNGTNWEWADKRNTDFNNLKRELTTLPCLAHYNGKKREYSYHGRQQNWPWNSTMIKTSQPRSETYRFRQPKSK